MYRVGIYTKKLKDTDKPYDEYGEIRISRYRSKRTIRPIPNRFPDIGKPHNYPILWCHYLKDEEEVICPRMNGSSADCPVCYLKEIAILSGLFLPLDDLRPYQIMFVPHIDRSHEGSRIMYARFTKPVRERFYKYLADDRTILDEQGGRDLILARNYSFKNGIVYRLSLEKKRSALIRVPLSQPSMEKRKRDWLKLDSYPDIREILHTWEWRARALEATYLYFLRKPDGDPRKNILNSRASEYNAFMNEVFHQLRELRPDLYK